MDCKACPSIRGEARISPGPFIWQSPLWIVDHAYPTSLPGWVVIVPRRHVEELHALTSSEWAEYAALLPAVVTALRDVTGCAKEYVVCLAEGEGFKHIHFHVIPRMADQPESLTGPRVFGYLNPGPGEAVPAERVTALCEQLTGRLRELLAPREA
jgi:diadenosine tetraphosphate (Ap4A) HIT family hydrolase